MDLKTAAQRAWLVCTDDVSIGDEALPTAEALFKMGFLAALQMIGTARRRRSRELDPAIAGALQILDRTDET